MQKSETQMVREFARIGARAEIGVIETKLRELYKLFPDEFREAPAPLLISGGAVGAGPLATDNGQTARPTAAVSAKRSQIWDKVATMLEEVAEPLSAAAIAERSGFSKQQIYNVMAQHKRDITRDRDFGTYALKKKTDK
jgi:hypothetical protein